MAESGLLTLPQVARALGTTTDEVLCLVETGQLVAGRGPDGGVYVQQSTLDSYTARTPRSTSS